MTNLRKQIKLAFMASRRVGPRTADELANIALQTINSSPTHMLIEIGHQMKCPHCGETGAILPEYVVKKDG